MNIMSNQALDELRTALLGLPEADRAKLALDLVTSLDGLPDSGVTEAWDKEILRRLAEVDSGTAEIVDREEFTRRLRYRISKA